MATIEDLSAEAPNAAFIPDEDEAIEYASSFAMEAANEVSDDSSEIAMAPSVAAHVYHAAAENAALRKELSIAMAEKTIPPAPAARPSQAAAQTADEELVLVSVPRRKSTLVVPSTTRDAPASEPEPGAAEVPRASQLSLRAQAENPPNERIAPPSVAAADESDPFGVEVSALMLDETRADRNPANYVTVDSGDRPVPAQVAGSFLKAFSAMRPESAAEAPSRQASETSVSELSPRLLKQDLYNTFISENEYLSPVEYAPDPGAGDEAIASTPRPDRISIESKFKETRKKIDLPSGPLKVGNREVLQMKLDFEPASSAVSGESVNIIRSFAQVAADQPTNSIEIGIANSSMNNTAKKRLAARRLAIVSNILRNAGLADRQIFPVLSDRDEDSFSFRAIGNDRFDRVSVSKGVDMFGDAESVQSYDLMRW
ncbi:MAG: hypothetical protein LBI17_02280 [Rickettsiales bacterium]|jgi:hypothetical protein|nr:hypothetical protein [Rickettsiales bacterium]